MLRIDLDDVLMVYKEDKKHANRIDKFYRKINRKQCLSIKKSMYQNIKVHL
ncbi:MAG: hypothetical protein ACOC2U_04055 [bacterium]